MTYIQQLDISDCGAACLGMVASHFGRSLNITQIRQAAGTDVVGTNINGMLNAAKSYGLKATAVKGTSSAIKPELECPVKAAFLTANNGRQAQLLPGLTAQARITVDSTTILKMIFKKLDFIK